MPRGDKSSYTDKQKRQAKHIEAGYRERGVAPDEAEARAWATVNKMTGGGKKSGSGRGKAVNKAPAIKGGRAGGDDGGRQKKRFRPRQGGEQGACHKRRQGGRSGRSLPHGHGAERFRKKGGGDTHEEGGEQEVGFAGLKAETLCGIKPGRCLMGTGKKPAMAAH